MNYQFKIDIKQQLLMLGPVILKNGILVWIYFYFFENIFPRYIFICVFTFFFVIDIFPTIVVHIQYLYRNFGALLVIDTKMKSISYKTEGYFVEHSFDDIFSFFYRHENFFVCTDPFYS